MRLGCNGEATLTLCQLNDGLWYIGSRTDNPGGSRRAGLACRERHLMAKNKETYQLTLETDQMVFVREAQERYEIADEDKVMRIIMDYVMTSPDLHEAIFSQTRCLRCD